MSGSRGGDDPVLERLATFDFHGVVASVATVTFRGRSAAAIAGVLDTCSGGGGGGGGSGGPLDALLLTFADAKLCLLGYSPTDRRLVTLSMHCFEEGTTGAGAEVTVTRDGASRAVGMAGLAQARVDPAGACAAMVCGANWLVVLPFSGFHEGLGDDEEAGGAPDATSTPGSTRPVGDVCIDLSASRVAVRPAFKLRLRDDADVPGTVLDFAFAYGYTDPTLAILHVSERLGWGCAAWVILCTLTVSPAPHRSPYGRVRRALRATHRAASSPCCPWTSRRSARTSCGARRASPSAAHGSCPCRRPSVAF